MHTRLPKWSKAFLAVALLLGLNTAAHAQATFTENFDYETGSDLTANGWSVTGTNTTPTIKVSGSGLSFNNSPVSNKGLAAILASSGQDVNRAFGASYSTGTVYVSFLVNINSAQNTGDYFFHLGTTNIGTTFFGRIFVKSTTGSLQFGLSKVSTPAAVYGTNTYALNTTHLVILKYTFNSGSTSDDLVELFVNPALGTAAEPAATVVGPLGGTDAANIGAIALRQGSATSAPTLILDGIQVGSTWASVTAASDTNEPTPTDTTPPTLAAANPFAPADNATGVGLNTALTVNFNESVKAGTGNILLNNLTDGTSQPFSVANTSAVTFNGTAVTLNGATLNYSNNYALQIPAGAITDLASNAFAGITDNTTWNFTTGSVPVTDNGTSLTALDVAYTQNFDGMGSASGTTNLPTNWFAFRVGGTGLKGQLLSPTTNNGSTNSGGIYNVGTTDETDRALGTLSSGSTVPTFGAFFTNNTGKIITSIDLKGFVEQWRTHSINTLNEVVAFEYSLDATSLTDGSWTKLTSLDLNELLTNSIAATTADGNVNRAEITGTITNIGWRTGNTLWIRWTDNDDSGSDGMYALDDFELTPHSIADVTAPTLAATNPLQPQTGNLLVDHEDNVVINFSEIVELGTTGSISVKNITDNTVQQIALSAVTINNNRATLLANLLPGKSYEVTVTTGVFKDLAANTFAGIAAGQWTFTTAVPNPYAQNFNRCETNLPGGWTQYSATGDTEFWACSAFGRTGNAVQMNGFNSGNKANEDWLISPAYDLSSGFTYPLLSFWSRTRFAGESLKLMVSTNYSGTGNPAAATWKEINGLFPALNSDVWTESANINLNKFKARAVYLAFVYTSTTSSAARWTLDDVAITNSETEPVTPVFFVSNLNPLSNFDFGFVTGQVPTPAKSFDFYALDLKSNLTVTAPVGFELSKDNQTFTATLTYTPEETFDYSTVYARFINAAATPADFAGSVKFTSGDFNTQRGYLTATTLDKARTLDVVTWNIEWFGSTGLGPTDESLQLENAKKMILTQDAEVYCVEEIANPTAFRELVKQLPGYRGFLSPFVSGSGGDNAQRVGFIYKTSAIDSVSARGLLNSPDNPANFWASGRLPYLFVADATVAGVKKRLHFIAIHAKANENGSAADAQSAYDRRISDLKVLKDSLDLYYPEANVVMLGDFNDDVDFTVANVPTTESTYKIFIDDAKSYRAVTKDLSDAGLRTYITFDNVIDHVMISDELYPDYLANSAKVIIPFDLIQNYGSTTSDHLPVGTRFVLTPNVSFAAAGSVSEGADNYNLNVELSRASLTAQTLTFAVQPGPGVTAADYAVSALTVMVPAGTTTATLPVTILDDNLVELDETLSFTVTNATGSLGYATTNAFNLTIQDNDKSTVSFSSPSVQLSESTDNYTVTLNLVQATVSEQTITVEVQNNAGMQYGTALDYTTNPAPVGQFITLTVPAGATSASFAVYIKDDNLVEITENVTFRISEVSSQLAIGSQNTFGITVNDNDKSVLSFNQRVASISENAGSYSVTLNLDQAAVANQTVIIGLTNSSGATYGTTAGSYTTSPAAINGVLNLPIPVGATSVSFTVNLYSSSKKEADKTIAFALKNLSGGLAGGSPGNFTLTVLDETNPAVGSIYAGQITVAPNPSSGPVTLYIKDAAASNAKNLGLTLWNSQGQQVLSTSGNLEKLTSDLNRALPKVPAGMYILKIVHGTTYYNTRLIRE